ncbi:ABC transporter permease [Chloroflexota bacterium]
MLNPRWYKVIRDLWANKTRTVLVVMAIAVGVFAFGSTFTTQIVLISEMDLQYQAIKASSITMNFSSFDESMLNWMKRQPEVADVQGRTVYFVKVLGKKDTYNMDLYTYEDYDNINMNIISPETGKWPPDRQEILVERSSLSILGVDEGEDISIELSNGDKRSLTVAGTLHDINAVPANIFPQPSGYVTQGTLRWLNIPATYNRLEISAMPEYDTLPELEKLADDLRKRLENHDITVNGYSIRLPDEHWGKEVTESFSLILGFIGMFSLVLSGFLVVNTISAMLTEQRRQIGIMKSIGATGKQISGIYLVLVACYGLLALLVAVPVGVFLSYQFILAVTGFLNINITNFHLPMPVLILQIIASILVPIIASIIPVVRGIRVTAREAISNYGISASSRIGWLDRFLLRVRGLSRPVLLSLRNTVRRKGRMLLTLGTLTLAGALFITVISVRASMMTWSSDILETWFNYDVEFSLDGSYPSQGVESRAIQIPGIVEAEGRTGIRAQRIKPDGTKGVSFGVGGIPPDTDFVQPDLLSGRWLEKGEKNVIVISNALIDDLVDVKVGDKITLDVGSREKEWLVAGVMFNPFDKFGYATFDYVSSLRGTSGMASSLFVRTEQNDGASQAEMAEIVENRLKDSGIKVNNSMTRETLASSWANQFDFLIAFLLAMAAMTALIGALGLAGMMSLNVMERTREIGIMRAIGAATRSIGSIVLTEGLTIGIISWILAVPISIPLSLLFDNMLGDAFFNQPLNFIFSPGGVIIWLVVIIFVSFIASILPAFRAMRMSVQETLSYE